MPNRRGDRGGGNAAVNLPWWCSKSAQIVNRVALIDGHSLFGMKLRIMQSASIPCDLTGITQVVTWGSKTKLDTVTASRSRVEWC